MNRSLSSSLVFAVIIGLAGGAWAQEKAGSDKDQSEGKVAPAEKDKAAPAEKDKADAGKSDAAKPKLEKATFGGGCFWCTEAVFERVPGVKTVVSGYSGGTIPYPTYEMVCTGLTGHAEVVQIEFDPDKVSYEKLLKVFFATHDPTTLNAQGPDFGTQYRSVIFYHDEAQKETAQKLYKAITAARVFDDPIVTDLVPFSAFYPADKYHQDYYRRNRTAPYCQMYIVPKLQKLSKLKLK
jgi:peptide-methionine (S)-S-oxide reductase